MPKNKNIVLFVGPVNHMAILAVHDLEKHFNEKFRIAFLMSKKALVPTAIQKKGIDFLIRVDIKNMAKVEQELLPIKDEVIVVNCRSVFYMPFYAQIISLFPHLLMPTRDSVEWCSNKLMMRRKFRRNFPEISPNYTPVYGAAQEDVNKIRKRVGFPCIVKPASLTASRHVSLCYHEEELQSTLKKIFRSLRASYKKHGVLVEPEVIVEQYMEGEMYSIDGYVDSMGKLTNLPAVHVKTAQNIGVDDFYGYRFLTPWKLSDPEKEKANDVAKKAVKSLGLRAVVVHMEFIKQEESWKILEVDARMGGHRDSMYRKSFAIPHGMNDLLTRMGEKPVIRKKLKQYAAAFNIFANKTGVIKSIKGLKKVRELESLTELIMVKKVGDRAGLSKNGFKKVLDIHMANKSKEKLLADMRRMEKAIKIEI